MDKARGLDVTGLYQNPEKMRYVEWRGLGFCYLFYEVAQGLKVMPWYKEHQALAYNAGYMTGPYLALYESGLYDPAAQARLLISMRHPSDQLPNFLDVERSRLTERMVRACCDEYDARTQVPLLIYTGKSVWEKLMAQPGADSNRYAKYELVIAAYPYDSPETDSQGNPIPQPMDPVSVFLRSHPPPVKQPTLMKPWDDYVSWQHTGHGTLPGYSGFLDLEVSPLTEEELRLKYRGGLVTTPQFKGTGYGIHAEQPGKVIPILTQMKAAGVMIASLLAVENPGLCMDAKKQGVPTTIWRFINPNPTWEGGQNVAFWTLTERLDFVHTSIQLILSKTNLQEWAGIDAVTPGLNEWCPNDPDQIGWNPAWGRKPYPFGWGEMGKVMCMLIDEAERRTDEFATLGRHRIRLAIPGFNAGTGEYTEMQAYYGARLGPGLPTLAEKMQKGNHLLVKHEGVFFNQPIDTGYGQALPGAPMVPNSGTLCFRVNVDEYVIEQILGAGQGIEWVAGEWYDGNVRATPAHVRLAAARWYQGIARKSKFFRGMCVFECVDDPGSTWYPVDFTPMFLDSDGTLNDELLAEMIAEKDMPNGQGDNAMIDEATRKALLVSAQASVAASRTSLQSAQATVTASTTAVAAAMAVETALVKLAPHVWKVGDVAVAIVNPLLTYNAPNGTVHDSRPPTPPGGPMITYDLNVIAVTPDQLWLQVASTPLWVRSMDVKLKGT